ncbi:MAG: alpha-2-macroglobulin family protein, partial [Chloroflexota bacterium]
TWVWDQLTTDASGKVRKQYTAPDSITTWMLRAVSLSKQTGLGVAEAQMKVFQKFFVTADLPYAVIRGEQFPVKVAVYNYTDKEQEFVVELDQSDWFAVVDSPVRQTVRVGANDVGGVSFTVRPTKLGTKQVKATARSTETADAIVKDIIVEPEGVARESVENFVLAANAQREIAMGLPPAVVEGSARGYFAITGNYLTQSIAGLEKLLQMPFGCGEQNMLLFAPNVFVTRYLKETGQLKPEVMAKAENMMITGYQRELTYRRNDGSFSAFGNQDKDGSLWLTAFVLKTFAQAKDIMYIDQTVLDSAKTWIAKNQKADGSFEAVGFVHHQELLGGLKGKQALTAYITVALKEAKDDAAAAKAVRYLEGELDKMTDPYAVAITAYAMELTKSPRANAAHDKLVAMAKESDGALYWGSDVIGPEPLPMEKPVAPGVPAPGRPVAPIAPINPGIVPPRPDQGAAIETTGYATLALSEHGDRLTAGRAARWLVSKRNSYGGFGSTQDTVVGLQALTHYAADARTDVDATVVLRGGNWNKRVAVNQANADVLQLVEVPLEGVVSVAVEGKGQVVLQAVRRWNEPEAEAKQTSAFQIDVKYGVDQVAVNDRIDITTTIKFTPPEPLQAGMTVLDVAVPTGFAAVEDSVAALAKAQAKIKRYDIAGRKVIIYIEDMMPDEQLRFTFQAQALYPVKAQAVASQAYSYYRPEWKGESLGGAMIVR